MLGAVDAISYLKDDMIVDWFVDGHLKSVLLRQKFNNFVPAEEIHFEGSKNLLIKLSCNDSTKVKSRLLSSILEKFNSSFSMRLGNVADEYKNIVFGMF